MLIAETRRSRRWIRGGIQLASLVVAGLFVAVWAQFLLSEGTGNIGVDFELYRGAAERWVQGDGFYLARQLTGPYEIVHGDVLYPPTALVLLVPFLVVPAVLWWIVPVGIVGWIVVAWRPQPLAWLVIALLLFFPITGVKLLHGNPAMWFTAAVAGGLRFAWPSVLVLMKPTLLPFAFIGVGRRSWWVALGILALASLPFLPMWPDYVASLLNARSDQGLLYSLNEVPLVAIPVIAWLGRARVPAR